MRIQALTAAPLLVLGLTVSACGSSTSDTGSAASTHMTETMSPTMSPTMSSTMTSHPMMSRTGTFMGDNGKHVAGNVTVTDSAITFAGFSSDEGPDLHVYLTNGSAESDISSGKEISAIRFDQASQTFKLSGVDASSYSTVVIHCDKANAVFGSAHLM